MEVIQLPDVVVSQLTQLGVPGAIITVLLGTIVILWRALNKERERCRELVNLTFKQSEETATMIERITGR